MSDDWPEVSIEKLKASSKNSIAMGPFGSRIKVENFVEDGIPIIKRGNLTGDFIVEDKFDFLTEEKADELKTSNAFRRDIIITHRGTIGQVGIIPDNSKFMRYVVSQSQLKVTLDQEKVNPYFVYYFLRSPVGQHRLLMNASQVGVPAIAQASTSVKGIMVPCPEKKIQDKVVEIILALDHKIHTNRQINQTLESISQAIFKSWFVDFDPVNAKIAALESGEDAEGVTCAAMRAISGKTDDELDNMEGGQPEDYARLKTTAELFPAAMQDSELGEVPMGWRGGTLNKLIKITSGKRPNEKSSKIDFEFVVPLIGASSIMGYVKETLYDKAILVIGRVGTHGVVQRVMPPSFPSDNTLVIQSEYYEFIYQILKIIDYKSLNVGSTQPLITQKSIKNYMIVVPKKEVLMNFENIVSGLFRKVAYDNQEIKKLTAIRDTLLPKLMSGEIRVKVDR